jgi:nicotinate-nucleotide pyrophosphorylase (carboxylating)
MGLYDMMMIKDNHITAAGGITPAISRAEAFIDEKVGRHAAFCNPAVFFWEPLPDSSSGNCLQGLRGKLFIEVETSSLEEVDECLQALFSGKAPHVRRIMLDNMTR